MRGELGEGLGVALIMALPVVLVIAVASGHVDLVAFFGPVGAFGPVVCLASVLVSAAALHDEPFALPTCLAIGGILPGIFLQSEVTNHPELLAAAFAMAALGPALVAIGGDLGRREAFLVLPLAGFATGLLLSLQPAARIDEVVRQGAPAVAAIFALCLFGSGVSRLRDGSRIGAGLVRGLAAGLAALSGFAAYETWIYVTSVRQIVY